jgi:tellurite methyltransferase
MVPRLYSAHHGAHSNRIESQVMGSFRRDRDHWNQKYRESPGSWLEPDPFLLWAYSEYIRPQFPQAGHALDLAGGAGRNAIWLAKQGWEVTLTDVAEAGVDLARQKAGPIESRIHFVIDDLIGFRASQTQFDLLMVFFYLDRNIFPELIRSIRAGGLLIYKTLTEAQLGLPGGPKDAAYLLSEGELPRLATGLEVLHYREQVEKKATAELIARKLAAQQP